MGFGEDMVLEKGQGIVTLDSGVVLNASLCRKTGLNSGDVKVLVGLLQEGRSWPQAKAELRRRLGSIEEKALEGWRVEAQRRANLDPEKAHTFNDLNKANGYIVLPAARTEAEQCQHRFGDLPPDVSRCVLKKHRTGGHVPGTPKYGGSSSSDDTHAGPDAGAEAVEVAQAESTRSVAEVREALLAGEAVSHAELELLAKATQKAPAKKAAKPAPAPPAPTKAKGRAKKKG